MRIEIDDIVNSIDNYSNHRYHLYNLYNYDRSHLTLFITE